MKRAIPVAAVLVLLAALLGTMSMAEMQWMSPWSDTEIKINVYGTLDDIQEQNLHYSYQAVMELDSGRIMVTQSEDTWLGCHVDLQSQYSTAGALGAGFYVENNTNDKVCIAPVIYAGRESFPSKRDEGEPLIVYDMNSRFCEDTVVQEWGTYELYAGFKGYIAMPLESYGVYSQADINAVGIRYAPGASFNQGEGNIVFDNFFLYGYDIEDNNSELIEREVMNLEAEMNKRRIQLEEDMAALASVIPEITYMPEYNPQGYSDIKAITYDSVSKDGKKTKSFAYIGYPEGAQKGDELPAIVLVHGGGGHAYADWVKYWNDNGYVAIAMDNTGYFPNNGDWVWGLENNPDFNEEGYTSAPRCDHFASSGQPLENQWMYHAVSQSILARNILAADERVDADKIGITGISWGGIITAQTIGFIKFAFAVPQYCSGYLDESMTYSADYCKIPGYNYLWKSEERFDNVDFPVLWLQWAQDQSASIVSTTLCYLDTLDVSQMVLYMNWEHGHDWTTAVETLRFADWAVKGGERLTKILNQPDGTRNVDFEIELPGDAKKVTARAYYITEKMTYTSGQPDQEFKSIGLSVDGNRITGSLPEEAYSFYVEVDTGVGGKAYYVATAFMDVRESDDSPDASATPKTEKSPENISAEAPVQTANTSANTQNNTIHILNIITAVVLFIGFTAGLAAYILYRKKADANKR